MDITLCVGSSCHLKGAKDIVEGLDSLIKKNNLENRVRLKGSFCMGLCAHEGISMKIGEDIFFVKPDEINDIFETEIKGRLDL